MKNLIIGSFQNKNKKKNVSVSWSGNKNELVIRSWGGEWSGSWGGEWKIKPKIN